MTTENSNMPARVATVALTKTALQAPATLMEMVQIPAIQDRWVKTYESVSGKKDGEMRFAAEMILFSQLAPKLEKCDRFTVYASFVELAISGLTLRDGLTYIVPFGNKAQFMVGWKGRLEQMLEVPSVIHVSEPQLVYDCDLFDYQKGMETVIHGHKPMFPRPEGAIILYVYMIVHFKHGKEVFMMDRDEVLNIRDNYSKSYKAYMNALKQERNKDKKPGDILIGQAKGQNGWYDFDIEPPMWLSSEGQAWKKTLVKRAWGSMEKLPKHQKLDERVNEFFNANPQAQFTDPDEMGNEFSPAAMAQQKSAVDEALNNIDMVDEDTGEVITEHTEEESQPTGETEAAKKKRLAAEKKAAKQPTPASSENNQVITPTKADEVDTTEGW